MFASKSNQQRGRTNIESTSITGNKALLTGRGHIPKTRRRCRWRLEGGGRAPNVSLVSRPLWAAHQPLTLLGYIDLQLSCESPQAVLTQPRVLGVF